MAMSPNVHTDELDCSKSCHRVDSDKTPEEVLQIGLSQKNTMYNFIFRDQYFLPQEYLDDEGKNPNRNYWDVGLCTIGNRPDYFLWIWLEEEDGMKLVEKYNLTGTFIRETK